MRDLKRILLPLLLACAPISWSSEIAQEASKGSNAADEDELARPENIFTTTNESITGTCLTKWLFETGLTRLQVAAGYCDTKTVQWLLDRGFDIEELNNDEETALHVASRTGNTDAALALVENGADIEAVDQYDDTPLHLASLHGNSETLLALIEKGADIHVQGFDGGTALYLAAGPGGNAETIMALVENGSDIDVGENTYGYSPLHNAAFNNPSLLPVLLKLDADKEALSDDGESALELSVRTYRIESARFLLEQGAELSGALLYAARSGNVEALQLLVDTLISRVNN